VTVEEYTAERREWKPATRNERVTENPEAELISGEAFIRDTEGNPVACVLELKGAAGRRATLLGNMLQRGIPWNDSYKTKNGSARVSGIRYANQVFGTVAPQPMRRRYGCRPAVFHRQRPDIVSLLTETFNGAWEAFQEHLPDVAQATMDKTTELIHDDWRFADTPWTSGIINDIVSIPYHRDSGNIAGTWSAMIVLRSKADGGNLHLPEYGITLECFDNSLVFFDGQAVWHGVTPISLRNKESFRRSIVMYTKRGCRECGPAEFEAARAAKEATEHDVLHDSPLKRREN
jgi:hypothetical protein